MKFVKNEINIKKLQFFQKIENVKNSFKNYKKYKNIICPKHLRI